MWKKIDDKHRSTLPNERSQASLKHPLFAYMTTWFRAYATKMDVLEWPNLQYDDYVTSVSAILYLKWHTLDLEHVSNVIRHFHPTSSNYALERENIMKKCMRWEKRILDDFIFPLARCLRHKIWEEEHKEIRIMERPEMRARVLHLWNERTCINMYPRSFQTYIDFPAIFRTPERHEKRVKPLRDYLEEAFFLAMEDALMLRIERLGANLDPNSKQSGDKGAVDSWRGMLPIIETMLPEIPEPYDTPVIDILSRIDLTM